MIEDLQWVAFVAAQATPWAASMVAPVTISRNDAPATSPRAPVLLRVMMEMPGVAPGKTKIGLPGWRFPASESTPRPLIWLESKGCTSLNELYGVLIDLVFQLDGV